MSNIERLSERLYKKHKNQVLALKVMKKLRDDLIKLENRLVDILEVSDNRIEFRIDDETNEVFYFKLDNHHAEFRIYFGKTPYLQVINPDTKFKLPYVVLKINNSEELTPLQPNNTPYNYSIHINELVDFVIGVVCFNLEFDKKETVLQ